MFQTTRTPRFFPRHIGAIAVILLSACSQSPITLSTDRVERAAQCAAYEGLYLRQDGSADAPITLEQFSRGMHPVLIEASRGEQFDDKLAVSISNAVAAEAERMITLNWRSLGSQCTAAYPETVVRPALASDELTAQIQCFAVSDFLAKSVVDNAENSQAAAARFRATADRILDSWDRKSPENVTTVDQLLEKIKRLGFKVFALGDPVSVFNICERRFSP